MEKIRIKIKIEKFLIEQVPTYIVVFCSIFLCAWIFNRWIEAILFCIAHTCIRNSFDKQFHFNKTAYCICLTLAIIWFSIPITLPLATSLLSSIPISFLICFFGFLAQDRIDIRQDVERLQKYSTQLLMQLQSKTVKDIYAMNEDELYEHCRNCGLDEEDCKIAYFIVIERLKGKELYQSLPYSEATIKRKRLKIMSKIKKDKTTTSF